MRTLLSWSSGKDCAWALHVLRQVGDVEVVGLVTTFNESAGRVAMHAVRRELVHAQADAVGLPLRQVDLPFPCSNDDYAARMRVLIDKAVADGVTHMAFGDLFLEDVRDYRIAMLAGTGITPVFPLFGTPADTASLARTMLAGGLKATITCVDPRQAPSSLAGRAWDARLLTELPPSVDPCGERGEFHTFCWDAPVFSRPIPVAAGEVLERDGFVFADVLPA